MAPWARHEAAGGSGLIHKSYGKTSNLNHKDGIRKYAVDLVNAGYADIGSTLATEMLPSKRQFRIGRETLQR